MAEPQLSSVLTRLRQLAGTPPGDESTDAQLLGRFAANHEESAFAALLERHGRLVWSVCRHVLRHEQDAEDAFQATFLVLARKAAAIRKRESLPSWLHGVAYRVALKARARASRQARHGAAAEHGRMPDHPPPSGPASEAALREVQAILDDEVRLLPEKLRAPFVLCCLEGRSKSEAARELGWKEGTVSGRLQQARDRLRNRLARRGVALTAALTATSLARDAAGAAVPAAIHDAMLGAVSGKLVVSSGITELAEGVILAMFVNKLRRVVFLLLLACLGAGWMAHAMRAGPSEKPAGRTDKPGARGEAKQEVKPPARRDVHGDPLPPGALARLGTLRFRHDNAVSAVVYGRDGRFVASSSNDNTIRLWDVDAGKELACLRGHTASVYCLGLSPDGKTLASGGGDGIVCLWDVTTAGRPGTKPRQLRGHQGSVCTLAFAPDGKTLFTGDNQRIRVWDVARGTELRQFGAGKGWVRSLALARDGKTLASANLVGDFTARAAAIHLWDPLVGKHIRELAGAQKTIYHIAFSPDGETLASGGDDGAKVWEVASGTQIAKLRGSSGYTPCVLFSPNGRRLLAGGGGFLREWRLPTGSVARSFAVGSNYAYNAAWSPDGKTLATGGTRSVTLWNVETAKSRHTFAGHEGEVGALLFTPDSKELLSGGFGRPIYRWEVATGKEVGKLAGPLPDWNSTLVLSPDGKTLAAQGRDVAVLVLDAMTGQQKVKFTRHLPPSTSAVTRQYMVFAPDGKTIYSATLGVDANIRKWEVDTGKEVLKMPLGPGNGSGLTISPDGKTLYSMTLQGPVRVWDATTGKEQRQIGKPGWGGYELLVSPDGRRLAVVLSDRVVVWEAATGREVCSFPPPRGWAHRLVFSPDSRTLAVSGVDDDRVDFREVATGQTRLTLAGHGGAVKAIAFSPDGRLFATGGNDTTALVWDYRALPLLGTPAETDLSPKAVEELIAALSSNDARVAFRAVCALTRAPRQAIGAIGERLGRVDPKKIDRLIGQLDDEDFEVREKAMKDLAALGTVAEPALRKVQTTSRDIDVRLRAGVVLRNIEKTAAPQRLRDLRALEVLEAVGTAEARRVLEDVSKGPAAAELTLEAKAALQRGEAKRKGTGK